MDDATTLLKAAIPFLGTSLQGAGIVERIEAFLKASEAPAAPVAPVVPEAPVATEASAATAETKTK